MAPRENIGRVRGVRRAIDAVAASLGLLTFAPILILASITVWLQDRGSPLYVATRIGRDGIPFRLVKLRSMVVGASGSGVDTTIASDPRVTRVGRMLRRLKLDELPQLWNVVAGHMSLVGPRPNVPREVARYNTTETAQLKVRPGLTDLASIAFADLDRILAGSTDPNRDYGLHIRPWKSRLGLLYVRKRSLRLDLEILGLTLVRLVSRRASLRGVEAILARLEAPAELRRTVHDLRNGVIPAVASPPGAEWESGQAAAALSRGA
jgi:lipopolysaccharide/colanic/teichoic acid biosynthesis glycosyltransferase